jgi:amino acid adenylation domain-containing protein
VAVLMDRSTDAVVAMLGVLKAGAAYLPLDPRHPAGRLAYIIEDAGASVVLADEASARLRPKVDARLLVVGHEPVDKHEKDPDLPVRTVPEDAAYIIYTSGSTGRPKGVRVSHANVTRLLQATQATFAFTPRDVWTCFHSLAFDFSVWEIWGALIHGGRLVMVPQATIRAPQAFLDLLLRERVTVLNQTPSAFGQLVRSVAVRPAAFEPALRLVIFGGEALDPLTLRPWIERFGDDHPKLVNMYGITETTVHVTSRRIVAADLHLPGTSPIGEPIADLAVHLLDERLEPVPDGIPGEICVTGPGLADGYWNRPDLTADRFVANPFPSHPGQRLYRSGDLGRRRQDGIDYLRRMDTQVKIRGHRIETAEIAAHLREHPAVCDAVVTVREGPTGDRRLCAYVVPEAVGQAGSTDPQLDSEQLADWQSVFDEQLRREPDRAGDPRFRLTGWISSYDRRPIPAEQMRAWLDGTVEQILALRPERLLEVGCGAGNLLFRLAPVCMAYHGVDFSASSLAHARREVEAASGAFGHVTLEQRAANELYGLPPASFDTVVINSVAQYFPSIEYLVDVLSQVLRLVRPGGAVFVGDVRDLRLIEPFHLSLQLARAPAELPAVACCHEARRQAALEKELLLEPGFFTSLGSRFPEIAAVSFHLQRGAVPNELNKYRYAAVLHLGGGRRLTAAPALSVEGADLRLADVEALFVAGAPDRFRIAGLRNGLLATDLVAFTAAKTETAGEVRTLRAAAEAAAQEGIRPEDLHRLARSHGYDVQLAPELHHEEAAGRFTAFFVRHGLAGAERPGAGAPLESARPLESYANDPLRLRRATMHAPLLRRHLEERVPGPMIPSDFVFLEALPLTVNGKIDLRALPAPDGGTLQRASLFVAPRTPTEEALATIFVELLGVRRVGVHDDFFALGGHSLLATSLCSRVRQRLGLELPLMHVFETPTVAQLSVFLDGGGVASSGSGANDRERVMGEI